MRDILDYIEERAFCEGYTQRMFDATDEKIDRAMNRHKKETARDSNAAFGTALTGLGGYNLYKMHGDEAQKALREQWSKKAGKSLTDEAFKKKLRNNRLAAGGLIAMGLAGGLRAGYLDRHLDD